MDAFAMSFSELTMEVDTRLRLAERYGWVGRAILLREALASGSSTVMAEALELTDRYNEQCRAGAP